MPSLLSQLPTLSPTGRPFALQSEGGKPTPIADTIFFRAFGRWHRALSAGLKPRTDGRAPRLYVLTEDTAQAAPLLFAAWSAGVETVLGSDCLPETLRSLRKGDVLEAGDALALEPARRWVNLPEAAGLVLFPELSEPKPLCCEDTWKPLPPLDDEAELASLFTGGSTAEAKRIRKRLGQLFFETEGVDRALRALPGVERALQSNLPVTVLSTVTHQHIYGILFRLLWPLLSLLTPKEAPVLLTAPRLHYPETLAAEFRRIAPEMRTLLVTSPAHLKRLDPSLFCGIPALSESLLAVTSSAGPLDDEGALNALRAFGRFPLEVLGSTETGGIGRRQRRREAERTVTPAWRPMPGVSVRLTDERTGEVRSEGTGIVLVSGPQIRHAEGESGADRIALDASGFTLLGRADRVLKIEGKRISPALVEEALLESGLFRAARVLSDPDAHRRDALAAALEVTDAAREAILNEGKGRFVKSLRTRLADRLTPFETPRRWRFVERLPVNARGKTTETEVARLFDAREAEWLTVERESTGTGRRFRLRTRLSERLAWFEGHFPDLPILPGVAQLLLVERILKKRLPEGDALKLVAVRNLKFKAVTRPGMTMDLTCEVQTSPGRITARFLWERVEDGKAVALHAQGTLDFIV